MCPPLLVLYLYMIINVGVFLTYRCLFSIYCILLDCDNVSIYSVVLILSSCFVILMGQLVIFVKVLIPLCLFFKKIVKINIEKKNIHWGINEKQTSDPDLFFKSLIGCFHLVLSSVLSESRVSWATSPHWRLHIQFGLLIKFDIGKWYGYYLLCGGAKLSQSAC